MQLPPSDSQTICLLMCSEDESRCEFASTTEEIVRNMSGVKRAVLGFMCKQIIDIGRLIWMKECGLDADFVKYVSPGVSPENHLLIARRSVHS